MRSIDDVTVTSMSTAEQTPRDVDDDATELCVQDEVEDEVEGEIQLFCTHQSTNNY